jgi:uncharacterized membrane protein
MYPGNPPRRRGSWLFFAIALGFMAVVVILVLLAVTGYLGPVGGRGPFGVWGGFLLLFLLLWVGFFVVRVLFWTRRVRGYGSGYQRPDPAVMIARRRYARGEITREQYEQIMTNLGHGRPPMPP